VPWKVGIHNPHQCPTRPIQWDWDQWDWDQWDWDQWDWDPNDYIHGDYHRSADHGNDTAEETDHGHPKRVESMQ